MTTIEDVLTYADGRLVNGQVVVNWPSFQVNAINIAGGMQTFPIVDGVFHVELQSNNNSKPLGMYYTAVFELEEGALYTEYWIIPDQPLVTLGQVRIGFPVTPSALISAAQLTSAGATYGQFLGWDGTHWVPMYVSTINLSPNYIALNLTAGVAANLTVSGSPATLGQSMTLNVPDAGPASRGVITSGPQTLGGQKTFEGHAYFKDGITVDGLSTFPPGYVVPQTPWAQDINAAGFRLTNAGSIGINHTLLPIPAPVAEPVLVVGPSLGDGIARIIVCGNTGGGALGAISFANSTIGAPDKRVAQITAFLDGSNSAAAMLFLTSAGIGMIERMRITSAGLVGIGKTPVTYRVEVAGDLDVTGVYRVNGVPTVSGVASVFGRVGAVIAQTGDYVVAQVTGAVPNTRQVIAGPGVTGGGALSADVTLAADVLSVFGRIGLVVAKADDYTAAQVTNAVSTLGSYADPPWITSLAWAKITGTPAFVTSARQIIAGPGLSGGGPLTADVTLSANVLSVFGRIGAVVAKADDYTAAQVTNAVSTLGSYADPAWITSLSWAKITGAPTSFPPAAHVHAAADITTGIMASARLGAGTANALTFLRGDGVWQVPPGGAGGGQTPWLSDINAANYNLNSVLGIGFGGVALANSAIFVDGPAYYDSLKQHNNSANGWAGIYLQNNAGSSLAFKINGTGRVDPNLARLESTVDLMLVTANTERVRITTGGSVGIGNTAAANPSADVTAHVIVGATSGVSSGQVNIASNITGSNGGFGGFGWANYAITGAEKRIAMILASTGAAINSGNMQFFTWNVGVAAERMRIAANGDVGIGKTPSVRLDVAGGRAIFACVDEPYGLMLRFNTVTNGMWLGGTSAGGLVISEAGGIERVRVTQGGAVGIGTAAPGALLEVAGLLRSTAVGLVPTTGSGVELFWNGTTGCMDAFDRAAGTYKPLRLDGSTVGINTVASGGVGIGEATPLYRCHISTYTGAASPSPTYHTADAGFGLDAPGNTELVFGWNAAAPYGYWMQVRPAWPLVLNPVGGNVGIAIKSPQALLHIAGLQQGTPQTAAQLRITEPGGNVAYGLSIGVYADVEWKCVIQTGVSAPKLLLNPVGGPVGIGTASPDSKLSFGTTHTDVTSRIAFFENPGSTSFRGIGMVNPAASVWGVGIFASTANTPTNTNMALFVRDGGNVGVGSSNPAAHLHVLGDGQVSGSFETVNPVGGFREMVYVQQTDAVAGSGGGVLFGWASGPFAAIKAYVQNGGGNSAGSLRFYTRAGLADTFLTCRMAIESTSVTVVGDLGVTGGVSVSGSVWVPQELRVGAIGASDYTWVRNGTDGYLYCTGSQVSYSGFIWRVDNGREAFRVANTGDVTVIPSTKRVGVAQAGMLVLCENTNAAAFRMTLGYCTDNAIWAGTIQVTDGAGQFGAGCLALNPGGGFVSIGPVNLRPDSPLHIRNNNRAGDPAIGTTVQPGGQFRIQCNDVGVDFGIYAAGETFIQAYNGITNLTVGYALSINPRGGPVGLGKKHTFTSNLAIGALPGASTGVPGDIWRDGSGFLRQV